MSWFFNKLKISLLYQRDVNKNSLLENDDDDIMIVNVFILKWITRKTLDVSQTRAWTRANSQRNLSESCCSV